jgi:hypothetical protein
MIYISTMKLMTSMTYMKLTENFHMYVIVSLLCIFLLLFALYHNDHLLSEKWQLL